VRTNNITTIQELKKYGKILFLSGLTDIVGIETKEEFITEIQHLVGKSEGKAYILDNVRKSQTGKMLS